MTEPQSLVERYLAAFAAGDIDAALACVHPDAVWRVDGDARVGTVGIVRGRARVRDWLVRFADSFRPLAFSVDRLIGDGDEVVAMGRFRHRVVPSGGIVDSDYAIRFTVRDGLIARYQIFEDSLLIERAWDDNGAARSATLNGTDYGWDDVGQGSLVVFLHGLFLDRGFWSAQVSAFAVDHRCVTFDMPGHGASGWRDGLDLDGIAEDLALWIEEHGRATATIVGHSQGGMVAMRLASRHSGLVERLVLVNTSARAEPEERLDSWRRRSAALLAGDDERAAALAEVQRMTTAADWIDRHPREVAAEHAMMMRHSPGLLAKALNAAVPDRGDVRALLASIDTCVDVLSGELDIATPPDVSAEIAHGVRHGRHRVVAGAAHHVPVEAPEVLAQVLADVR